MTKQYSIVPFTDWCYHYALIFVNGQFLGKQKININKPVFKYKDRLFNFIPNKATKFKLLGAFWYNKYYIYEFNNPDPIKITHAPTVLFNSKQYKEVIDNDIIEKLNKGSNNFLFADLLKPSNLIFILVLLAVVYYFSSGGTLT